jgi:hypothetical protein
LVLGEDGRCAFGIDAASVGEVDVDHFGCAVERMTSRLDLVDGLCVRVNVNGRTLFDYDDRNLRCPLFKPYMHLTISLRTSRLCGGAMVLPKSKLGGPPRLCKARHSAPRSPSSVGLHILDSAKHRDINTTSTRHHSGAEIHNLTHTPCEA